MGLFSFSKSSNRYQIPRGVKPKDYAQSLLDNVNYHCEEINNSASVFNFSYSYSKLSDIVQELIWLNERKHVFMAPSPRFSWAEIQRDMPLTINAFLNRVLQNFPSHGESRADAIDDFLSDIEQDALFYSLFSSENRSRLENLRSESSEIKKLLEQEEELRRKAEILHSIGFQKNIDVSSLDPFEVSDHVENALELLYQNCLVNGLSPFDTWKTFSFFLDNCNSSHLPLAAEIRLETIFSQYEPKFKESNPMYAIDSMNGKTFECWCASLLQRIGFTNVTLTKASGDDGVDLLAEKDNIKYAIQCKCYSKDLGKAPIQEVAAGKMMPQYHCQIGAVITNRHFTKGARALADANGVLLWDRDWIIQHLKK